MNPLPAALAHHHLNDLSFLEEPLPPTPAQAQAQTQAQSPLVQAPLQPMPGPSSHEWPACRFHTEAATSVPLAPRHPVFHPSLTASRVQQRRRESTERTPQNDMMRVLNLRCALNSRCAMSGEDISAVLTLLTLASTWPVNLRVLFSNLAAQPPCRFQLPRVPVSGPLPLRVEIELQPQGDLRVGRYSMPSDLRTSVAASEWSAFDALLTGVRLLQYGESTAALQSLLAGINATPASLRRQVDPQGQPTGAYLQVLQSLHSKAVCLVEKMTHVAQHRLTHSRAPVSTHKHP